MEILFIVIAVLFGLVLGTFGIARWVRPPPDPVMPAAPPDPPACLDCKHFDLVEGQAVLHNHPHFLHVAQYVSPAEMGRVAKAGPEAPCKDCDGKGEVGTMRYADAPTGVVPWPQQSAKEIMIDCSACDGKGTIETQQMSPPSAPYKAKWSEFGACFNSKASDDGDSSIRWSGDSCEHFELKLVQLRSPA